MSPDQEKFVAQVEARIRAIPPGPRRIVGDRFQGPKGPVVIAEARLTGPMAPTLRATVRPQASLRILNQAEKEFLEHARDDLALLLFVVKQQAAQIAMLTQAHSYVVEGVSRETEQRRKAEAQLRIIRAAWDKHIRDDLEMNGGDVVEWVGEAYERIDRYFENKAKWNEVDYDSRRSLNTSLTIPEVAWMPAGPDTDPRLRMLATVYVDNAPMHFEAWRVKLDDKECQVLDSADEEYGEWYNGWADEAGGDGPFETARIFDADYVIFASPHT